MIAAAVKTGARKHIRASCVIDARGKVCDAPLARSVKDPLVEVPSVISENRTTTGRAPRYATRNQKCRGRRDAHETTLTRIGFAGSKCQNQAHNLDST